MSTKRIAGFRIEFEELVIIAKNRPLNALQFNVLAIVFLLVVLPFAVAFVSNSGESKGTDFEPSFNHFEPYGSTYGGVPAWWWNNGGTNYSSLYTGDCAHIVDGICTDLGTNSPAASVSGTVFDSFFHPSPGLVLQQTHNRGSDYGTDPYAGSSGDGPFEWLIPEGSQNAIENNQTFDVLRFGFIDHQNSFNCASHAWVDLKLQYSIEFEYNNETKTYSGFYAETSNKFLHYPYPSYHEECNVGFYIEYDFNAFESLEMVNWNGGNWDETNFYIKIDSIERDDGLNIANTELPFSGNGDFTFTSEYSMIDQVQANFFINMGTLVLSVFTFALAVASTPYWDPFKNLFRGAL